MVSIYEYMDEGSGDNFIQGSDGTVLVSDICDAITIEHIPERLSAGDVGAIADLMSISGETYGLSSRHYGPQRQYLRDFSEALSTVTDEVEDLARGGLHAEAVRRLDLVLHPKWDSLAACDAAYGVAIGRVYGPADQRSAIDRLHGELASLPMFAPPSCQPHASER